MPDAGAGRETGAATRAVFTCLDPVTCRRRTLLAIWIWTFREQCLKERVAAHRNKIKQVLDESVLVFVCHTCYMVHDIAGVVLHQKLGTASLKVRVGGKSRCTLYKAVVSRGRIRVCSRGGIVQSSEDPRGAALLNKVADDLVIEVFDLRPLDLLTDIFFLFSLQSQLDEDLLQLLVDVVDAELFERIFLECRFSVALRLNILALPRRSQIRKYPVMGLKCGAQVKNEPNTPEFQSIGRFLHEVSLKC
jgi:hypothetical protein